MKATATVENLGVWNGKVRFSLGPQYPAGATIDSKAGEIEWTPPRDQAAGNYDFTVFAETPDGRHDETTLVVTVTVPIPLKLKPIEAQIVEAGKPLSVAVALDSAEVWKGKARYSLGSPTPPGASIDASTGVFTWTPTEDQAADKHNVTVLVTSPDGRRDETSFVVNVLRPIPPLRLQAIGPQTVEAGKELRVAVPPDKPAQWQGKVRFSLTVTRPVAVPVTLPSKEIAVDLGNDVKLEMVLIPAGEFMMGSPDSDIDAPGDEKPQHRVRITRPFYLGKYLVTQEQWEAVMGNNPSHFKGPKNPVETVSWNDCQAFLLKLD